MLIAWAKSWSAREASHQLPFMDNCRTISLTFYSPIYPVDEGNEDVGSVWDNIFFSFGVNQVHWFILKPGAQGEYLMCIVSAKITDLRERLKC